MVNLRRCTTRPGSGACPGSPTSIALYSKQRKHFDNGSRFAGPRDSRTHYEMPQGGGPLHTNARLFDILIRCRYLPFPPSPLPPLAPCPLTHPFPPPLHFLLLSMLGPAPLLSAIPAAISIICGLELRVSFGPDFDFG
jgi:hypothetical protein